MHTDKPESAKRHDDLSDDPMNTTSDDLQSSTDKTESFSSEEPFTPQTAMIMRRMRTPLLILISVYAIAVLGMVLIPGIDDHGNPWNMTFFHAFYLVSYTATTIGFGEIPYALTDAQRMWVLCTIYMTVIAWFYAIGSILALVQDPVYQQTRKRERFKKEVAGMSDFYLVCGLGETGFEIVKALSREHYRAIVIEEDESKLLEHNIHSLAEHVPVLIADAAIPKNLKMAGIADDHCKGVIAATASDEINLKIAISSKLLHPDGMVVCRSDIQSYEENMLSFKTDHVINPYRTFATIFSMLLHSSSMYMIFNWLTGAPDCRLSEIEDPLKLNHGRWILCGYGRFGKTVHQTLQKHQTRTTILEADPAICEQFKEDHAGQADNIITGSGVDETALNNAEIEDAVGIIAGTDDDSNNLSIIMTAMQMNPDIFVVARQNQRHNTELFERSKADLVMQPREITARIIRAQLLNALLIPFLNKASERDTQWTNITITRLIAVAGECKPHVWTTEINQDITPAIMRAMELGRSIKLDCLLTDPAAKASKLDCVALLHERDGEHQLLPDDDIELQAGDKILFCGKHDAKDAMQWIQQVMSSLNYVMSYESEPESFIWRRFFRKKKAGERRNRPR
ncbi:MAG: NAD-binding protein [Proteobacteria bacterium]|nr:NAD-binding protein [Pseudomonadota bacterium]